MTGRTPPRPEDVKWQSMVPPSPHNGGWAGIMTCRRMLHYPDTMIVAAWRDGWRDRVYDRYEEALVEHGLPPLDFMRAWLLDTGTFYWWMQHDHPGVWRNGVVLEATRALWREIFGSSQRRLVERAPA